MKNSEDNRNHIDPMQYETADEKRSRLKREKEYRKGESQTAKLWKLAVTNAILIFFGETVLGTVSNVFVYGFGWLVTLTGNTPKYYTAEISSRVWLLLAFVSMLVCGIGIYYGAKMTAARAAEHRYNHSRKTDIDISVMLVSILGGSILHGLLCLSLSFATIQTLFIAGPVQYIARYLTGSVHTIFSYDVLVLPLEDTIASISVYILLLTAVCFLGYFIGHGKTIRHIKNEEKNDILMSKTRFGSAEYSYEDNATVKEEILRDTFPKRTEERLKKINKNKIVTGIIFTAVWFAADIALWLIWAYTSGRDLLSPSAAFFTALLIVPFYPLRMHERFFGKTYYANVADVRLEEIIKAKSTGAARGVGQSRVKAANRMVTEKTSVLYLRTSRGDSIRFEFPGITDLPYKKGDRVLKLSAFRYPIKTSLPDDEIFCPQCARVYPAKTAKCRWCGTKLK